MERTAILTLGPGLQAPGCDEIDRHPEVAKHPRRCELWRYQPVDPRSTFYRERMPLHTALNHRSLRPTFVPCLERCLIYAVKRGF